MTGLRNDLAQARQEREAARARLDTPGLEIKAKARGSSVRHFLGEEGKPA